MTINDTRFNNEIALLAERSDGSRQDAIIEWGFRPEEYPTLCAYVRRGITSQDAILTTVTNRRVRRVLVGR